MNAHTGHGLTVQHIHGQDAGVEVAGDFDVGEFVAKFDQGAAVRRFVVMAVLFVGAVGIVGMIMILVLVPAAAGRNSSIGGG